MAKEALELHRQQMAGLREDHGKLVSVRSELDQRCEGLLGDLEQANAKLLECDLKHKELLLVRDGMEAELCKEREEKASLQQEGKASKERLVQLEQEWQMKRATLETELTTKEEELKGRRKS